MLFGARFHYLAVYIAQGSQFYALLPFLHIIDGTDVAIAPATETNGGAAQSIIGSLDLSPALGGPSYSGSCIEGGFKKITTGLFIHK